MKEDFNWLRNIMNSPKNTAKHFDAIYTLVDLFKKKWSHYASDPVHGRAYAIYVSYLRITLKSLYD
jgi:hypothetical protein